MFASDFGIVIPVRHEPPEQVAALVREILSYLVPSRIVIVDDSDAPGHWESFQSSLQAALEDVGMLRLIHRQGKARWGRLAGAVVDGFAFLRDQGATYAAVIDGDGQHDPVALPFMYVKLGLFGPDLVSGTRYSLGGSPGSGLSLVRRLMSKGCHALAKGLFPLHTRGLHDTMSGYFAVRLDAIPEHLWADRFKIMLQIVAQTPGLRTAEVPYTFRTRGLGTSNAGPDEAIAYLKCLVTLVKLAYLPHGERSHAYA
jgi:dolichol-phosphate mannosyltransferase